MNLQRDYQLLLTRRQLFGRTAVGIGSVALASLLNERLFAADRDPSLKTPGALPALHFAPKAKRVIYLFMSGGPSHIDLFDYKPKLKENHGKELPASVRMGQRVTGMTAFQKSFPCVAPMFKFAQHGKSGAWVSELLPNIATVVDNVAIVKSLNTEAINHDPAITYIQTGSQQPGRPSLGAWLSYGIGSLNHNLPAFIVMISQGSGNKTDQPLFSRLWGSGFVPTEHQGVRFRSGNDPVLYLSNPPGLAPQTRSPRSAITAAEWSWWDRPLSVSSWASASAREPGLLSIVPSSSSQSLLSFHHRRPLLFAATAPVFLLLFPFS